MIRALRLRRRPRDDRWSREDSGDGRGEATLHAEALASIGIDLDEVRRRVEEAFGPGALERTRAGGRRR